MNQEQISRTKWDPGKKKCQKEKTTTKENETEKRITTTEIATICIAWVPILIVQMMSWITELIKKRKTKSEIGKHSTNTD